MQLRTILFYLLLVTCYFFLNGCNPSFGYSFKGISIPADVKTFYVELFDTQDPETVPTLPRDFTEKLKDRIRRESNLQINDTEPDIEFSGAITRFQVTAEAPKADEEIGFNKLTIAVNINFVNNKDEEANWKQQFSFDDFFEPDQNLLEVQDQLIENITDELVERIFNKAFTNW
ncbi:MAG: LptE family protein [Bacteroidota bacterium]